MKTLLKNCATHTKRFACKSAGALKKIAMLAVAVFMLASQNAFGEPVTITITVASINGEGNQLGSNGYNGGAERTWTQGGIDFGGKAITQGQSGNVGTIQAQANNGVIYNTTAIPGRITSISFTGTVGTVNCYGGSTSRLVNDVTGNYTVDGGTQVGTSTTSTAGWTSEFDNTDYTFFVVKKGATAAYFSAVIVTYEPTPTGPTITASEATVDFGNVLQTEAAEPVEVTVTGANLTNDLATAITGDHAADFSVTPDESWNDRTGGKLSVGFTPSALGARTATLTISSDGAESKTITLSGVGLDPTSPILRVHPPHLTFALPQMAGTQSAPQGVEVTFENLDDEPLTFTLESEDFTLDQTGFAATGDTVHVKFTPATAGAKTAKLYVACVVKNVLDSVELSGTGVVTTLTTNVSALDFPHTVAGENRPLSVNISATYLTADVTLAISGDDAALFTVDSAIFVLPSNGTLSNKTARVTYAPLATGAHAATLAIASLGVDTVFIPLTGQSEEELDLLLVEDFDYTVGTTLASNGWTAHSGQGTSPIQVTNGLTFPGYDHSGIGGAAAVFANGEDVNRAFAQLAEADKVYMAFMFQTQSANSQGYFMHLSAADNNGVSSSAFAARVFVNANGTKIGIIDGSATPASADWHDITANTTYLGVVEYDVEAKLSNLYVFDQFPSEKPASGFVTSTTASTISTVAGVALRQYSNDQKVIVDGIRIARTWGGAVVGTAVNPNDPAVHVSGNGAFGTVTIGNHLSREFTITGEHLTGDITYEIEGADAAAFTAEAGTFTAANGGTIHVTFTPTEEKEEYEATLAVSSEGAVTRTIALTGAGTTDIYYLVTFDSQGGSEVDAVSVEDGDIVPEPNAPTKDGYTFGGWYTEATCENAWDFAAGLVTQDTTLYAKWTEVVTYTVTFDAQGGSAVASQTVAEGGLVIEPTPAPTKENHTFGGWYKEAGCTNVWHFATDIVEANITLYAKWTEGQTAAAKEFAAQVAVYPNPVADRLYISAPVEVAKVEIINGLGVVLQAAAAPADLKFSPLPNGIYYIRITFANGSVVVKRVTR